MNETFAATYENIALHKIVDTMNWLMIARDRVIR